MKKSHYFRLLGYEPGILLVLLAYSAWSGWSAIKNFRNDEMFSLHFGPADSFTSFMIFMGMYLIFKNLPQGFANRNVPGNPANGDMEFLFTRAISRRSVFYTKTTRYLLLCLLPVVISWVYSYTSPVIRLELPYPAAKRAATEQFYLANFHGSSLQPDLDDKEGNKVRAILPHGKVDQAFFTFAWVCFEVLAYQFVCFLFWGKRWWQISIWLVFLFIPGCALPWLFSSATPSVYETGLAWVTLHASLTLLALALLAGITQIYSCHRYINAEIIS